MTSPSETTSQWRAAGTSQPCSLAPMACSRPWWVRCNIQCAPLRRKIQQITDHLTRPPAQSNVASSFALWRAAHSLQALRQKSTVHVVHIATCRCHASEFQQVALRHMTSGLECGCWRACRLSTMCTYPLQSTRCGRRPSSRAPWTPAGRSTVTWCAGCRSSWSA